MLQKERSRRRSFAIRYSSFWPTHNSVSKRPWSARLSRRLEVLHRPRIRSCRSESGAGTRPRTRPVEVAGRRRMASLIEVDRPVDPGRAIGPAEKAKGWLLVDAKNGAFGWPRRMSLATGQSPDR